MNPPRPQVPIMQPSGNMLPQVSDSYQTSPFDADFWDPNILSTTNWLDAIVDSDFSSLPVDFDLYNPGVGPFNTSSQLPDTSQQQLGPHTNQVNFRNQARSPIAATSTVSGLSGVSTESAADLCAAREDSPSKLGKYYVDGEAARLPRTKRRKVSSRQAATSPNLRLHASFSLKAPLQADADLKHRIAIPTETYEAIFHAYHSVCLRQAALWPSFEQSDLPSKETFEYLLGLYFTAFHQTLPFLHPATFDPSSAHWMLILAIAVVGARYIGDGSDDVFANSLSEFGRRCVVYGNENAKWFSSEPLTVAQIELLVVVGLVYSGDERLTKFGKIMRHNMAMSHSIVATATKLNVSQHTGSENDQWTAWIRREELTRTAYSIWLLDSMLAYHFQLRPLLSLNDTTTPLPCNEKLWGATTAKDWNAVSANQIATPRLQEALQELYIEKRLPRDRGEFARILIIHGLFARTWEVERYFSNPLSQWEPTATRQQSAEILPPPSLWLPSIPTYTKWQNSVCDCLDILHWQANSSIGQASGLEHPTVAFLHLARIVLLSPTNSIVSFATAMAGRNGSASTFANDDQRLIQRWSVQGQYKARLAAIHAGVTLWHIRRYSIDGFYEAPAVALATLMLWAFGSFSARRKNDQQTRADGMSSRSDQHDGAGTGSQDDESSDDAACGIILLDRPTDDELVQQFIRRGHTMQAHITGVGDLYSPRGPQRVLVEGCKLLSSLKCWGVNKVWLDLLQRLSEACKK